MTLVRTRSTFLLFTVLSALGCAGRSVEDPGRPPLLLGLPGIVDSVRNTPPLDRTQWGVGAYDYDADRMLLRVNVDRHFVPGSNMKLLVSAAALGLLGPDFRYTTTIEAEDLRDGVARALIVRGSGDPTLSTSFHRSAEEPLSRLADSVAASGVRRVDGPLVIDASYFTDPPVHPSWEIGDLDWYYAAPVAAFAIEEAAFAVSVRPGRSVGDSATIELMSPHGVVSIENAVTTDTVFSGNTVDFARVPGSNSFRFIGRIPVGSEPDEYRITVQDPARYAGEALRDELRRRGVEIGDSLIVLDWRTPATSRFANTGLAGLTTVATLQSPPMSEIVEVILEPSNNWVAEQVLKTLGAQRGEGGTWRAGAEVERRWLIDVAGLDSAAFHIVDGSGLSVQNLLTPDAIMRLLFYASEQPWGPIYRAALPEPGEVESTLDNRLAGYEGRVFAKTGTLTHVNALSGYLVAADGREIIFSVLTNASGVPSSLVRAGIDRIVEALAAVGAPVVVPQRQLAP